MRDDRLRVFRHPLVRAGRALGELPLETEQVLEKVVAPLRGRGGPGHFQAAGDRVGALAAAMAAHPAEALVFKVARFRLHTHVRGRCGAVRLAEGVTTGDQCHGLFVVHCHAGEGLADVARGGHRIGFAFGAFGVHVDEAHLHRSQRVLQVALILLRAAIRIVFGHQHTTARHPFGTTGVAHVAFQPLALAAPVHVLVGLPGVGPATGEAQGLEAHGFQGHIARKNHEVSPGNPVAVLLLDRPQQTARLVQAHVVGPAVERGEALLAPAGTAPAVTDAVGAGAVPGHADHQAAVVAEVGRPPVLRIGHQRVQVFLQALVVKLRKRLGVVEVGAQRVGLGRVLVQQINTKLLGPPVAVGGATTAGGVGKGAFGFGHGVLLCLLAG
jgi:hypothetical protein